MQSGLIGGVIVDDQTESRHLSIFLARTFYVRIFYYPPDNVSSVPVRIINGEA